MFLIRRCTLFFTLLLFSSTAQCQEEFGFLNSNYAGVNSLFLNPSFNVDSKIFIDVHLIGFDLFAHSNVMYFDRSQFSPIVGTFSDPLINETPETKKVFTKAEIIGPSVAVSWKQHSFGLFTRFRNYLDAKMSPSLFRLALEGFNYSSYYGKTFSETAYVTTLSWLETGFSYGYMFKKSSMETLNFGVNVKRLNGVSAAGVNLDQFDFTFIANKDMDIVHVDGGYRMANPGWNIGTGWGIDIGANYQRKLESVSNYEPNTRANGCKHIDYKYKIGFSLLDIGAISIDQGAILREFIYKSERLTFDSTRVRDPQQADQLVSQNLTNNQVQQVSGNSFWMFLPFAISGQFDYNFENHFFVNFTTVNSFKFAYQPKRIDVLGITPRYERKYFEIALPVTLVDYTYPQIGLALRLGNNLIIGSDRIDALFGNIRDVYGADIYFHLKLAFFKKCDSGSGGGKVKRAKLRKCAAYS